MMTARTKHFSPCWKKLSTDGTERELYKDTL